MKLNHYLVTFRNQPSIVVQAPDASAALSLCTGKISTYEEISGSRKMILVDMFGLKFVKWPF
jgi:hypothetical protein